MPAYLIFLWLLVLVIAILFFGLRLYGRRRSDVVWPESDTAVPETNTLAESEESVAASSWPQAQVRWLVAVLFVFGLLLVFMGQAIYRVVPLPERWAVFGFMALGVLSFLLATKRPLLRIPLRGCSSQPTK